MTIYDYLLWVVIWILGAVYGWYARERQAKRTIDMFFNQVEETIDASVLKINIEKHGPMFYVYDKETNDFMAQGNTVEELESNLAKRYPDKRFAADKDNLRILK
jgi:predicted metal-dependent RNase